ncbi:putative rhodanese-related sulfurtransferase [Klebsiella pneumoniae]|uniref:Putative rhodanese-related sulfurtransferase n=1 Tax=Klebsiella pneumoniae TaxID=573 RepID=A0A377XQD0_KLEPN|nr:putative rhodanese-related sulfurtransferase [Klebsiella pneumoniae]
MPVLHNRISNETLKAQMLAETEPRTTISFYKYFTIVDPQATRDALWVALTQLKVFGRIYLAREGINAQISVPQSNVEALREFPLWLRSGAGGLRFNIAVEDDGKSFWVLRLKVRDRIVADGIDDPSFDASMWGSISRRRKSTRCLTIRMPVFIDMRNHYEYEVGHSKTRWRSRRIPSATSCRKPWK